MILVSFLITTSIHASPSPSQFSKFSRQAKVSKGSFDASLRTSMKQAELGRAIALNVSLSLPHQTKLHSSNGIDDCIELLDDTIDLLSTIINNSYEYGYYNNDVRTRLSAALTNQETCMESIEKYKFQPEINRVQYVIQGLSHSISGVLAMYVSMTIAGDKGRKLLSDHPTWLTSTERKILEASIDELGVNAIVDKQGNGTHESISQALEASLAGGGGRSVIYIKAGTYHENINIPTKQKNVMLVGDGKGKTVIVGDRNSEAGWTTFQSATVGQPPFLPFI